MSREQTILRVGLTGNIGAGKSTVGASLAEAGFLVVDADRLGHELLAAGTPTTRELAAWLGTEILQADGSIDRAALAARAFASDAVRERLNGIMHPRIRVLEQNRVADWDVESGVAVTEAALLVETGAAKRYHRLVVVVAPDAVRRRRLVARGLSEPDIRRRMASQLSQEAKVRVAHYVLDNGGSLTSLQRAATSLAHELLADLATLARQQPLPPRSSVL